MIRWSEPLRTTLEAWSFLLCSCEQRMKLEASLFLYPLWFLKIGSKFFFFEDRELRKCSNTPSGSNPSPNHSSVFACSSDTKLSSAQRLGPGKWQWSSRSTIVVNLNEQSSKPIKLMTFQWNSASARFWTTWCTPRKTLLPFSKTLKFWQV